MGEAWTIVIWSLAILVLFCFLRPYLPNAFARSAPLLPDSVKDDCKTPVKPFGSWTWVSWRMPSFSPLSDFMVTASPPVAYRPFKWNSYPINMGIRPMIWTSWLQLDSEYEKVLSVRRERINSHGTLVSQTRPGFRPHAMESLLEIASFLALRYPLCFKVGRSGIATGDSVAGEEAGAIVWVKNLIDGEMYDFARIEEAEGPHWDPMRIAGLLVEDDLAVMVENEDGEYILQAGSICTAGTWRLVDKIGQSLDSIHSRGGVVGWQDKLKFSMERFFQRLQVEKPVERNNYWIQASETLPWSETAGPESAWNDELKRPDLELLKTSENPSWTPTIQVENAEGLWLRNERQTLRRLPKTGAILFTIRTYMVSIPSLSQEPGSPGRLASALRSWSTEIQAYKGAGRYLPVLLPYLDAHHRAQVAEGSLQVLEGGEIAQKTVYPF